MTCHLILSLKEIFPTMKVVLTNIDPSEESTPRSNVAKGLKSVVPIPFFGKTPESIDSYTAKQAGLSPVKASMSQIRGNKVDSKVSEISEHCKGFIIWYLPYSNFRSLNEQRNAQALLLHAAMMMALNTEKLVQNAQQ